MLKFMSYSLNLHMKDAIKSTQALTCGYCSKKVQKIQEESQEYKLEKASRPKHLFSPQTSNLPFLNVWNEAAAVKKNIKENRPYRKIDSMTDFLNFIQNLRSLPINPKEMLTYLRNKRINRTIVSQEFLHRRHNILKPDLAAAHFLLGRGGAVKFIGKSNWMGKKGEKSILPNTYVPGYFIEAIDAEGTDLYPEGLLNLCSLNHLKYMSFKGCEEINDWALDWISMEYHSQLEHLDLTDCKSITYRGFSCFYRFEKLKILNIKGVPETPELKLACLMLQDIMPRLEILGIDLMVPEKIEPVNLEEVKNIPAN